MEKDNQTFRILSLDGGGVRGVFQAAFLVRLAQQLPGPIADYFQLIAGTSTGSIIGMGLALGIDPNRILDSYKNLAGKIFNKWQITKTVAYLGNEPIYDQRKLKAPLLELFENKQLGQAKTKVLITASSLDRFRYRTFTNMPELGSVDHNLSAVDVVLASAAAPTYFKSYRPQGENRSYVDGGLWANSPSLIAVLAANRRLGIPFERIRLLSIATGDFPNGISPAVYNELRPAGITTIQTIFEIMFSCQSKFADDYATRLLGKPNAIRISTPLEEMMPLDDAKGAISKLPQLADVEAEKSLGEVLEMLTKEPLQPAIEGEIDILGAWSANWYREGKKTLSDKVTFSSWINSTQFEGYGEIKYPNKEYKYSIAGEVSRTGRIVVLVYKAERFPTEANIGTACLQLSISAEELEGTWTGFVSDPQPDGTKQPKLMTGKITMKKINI